MRTDGRKEPNGRSRDCANAPKNGSCILHFDVLKQIEILKLKTLNLFAQGIIKYLARLTGPSSAICIITQQ